jgi:hypothetical protein
MWLITTNDRKLIPAVHAVSGAAESQLVAAAAGVYGANIFASENEVLSLKRPITAGTPLPGMIAEQLRSNRVLATLDVTEGLVFRPQNTMPFRHKGWVFAMIGDDPPALPDPSDPWEIDFLQRNLRGSSEMERIANLVICRIVRTASGRTRTPDAALVREATLSVLDSLQGVEGFDRWACAVTTAHTGIVMGRGIPVHFRTIRGEESGGRRKPGILCGPAHVRATMVVAGPVPESKGWTAVPGGACVVVDELPPGRILE